MEPVSYLPKKVGKDAADQKNCSESKERKVEEREHIASAYRFSKVPTPATTPATANVHDTQQGYHGLQRSRTKDSLVTKQIIQSNRSRLPPLKNKDTFKVDEKGRETTKAGDLRMKNRISTDKDDDQRICEDTLTGYANGRGIESAPSDRAISPSSRTNIPSDLWAELHTGGDYDHRRLVPRSTLDLTVNKTGKAKSILLGYQSPMGLSIYSYNGLFNKKPSPPRLPKSFTYLGVYRPIILPQMPAALTVVPVPSIVRPNVLNKLQEAEVELSKVPSISIPPVPVGSPVHPVEIPTATCPSVSEDSELDDETKEIRNEESDEKLANDTHIKEEKNSVIDKNWSEKHQEIVQENEKKIHNVTSSCQEGEISSRDQYVAQDDVEGCASLKDSQHVWMAELDECKNAVIDDTCTTTDITCATTNITCTTIDITCAEARVTKPVSDNECMEGEEEVAKWEIGENSFVHLQNIDDKCSGENESEINKLENLALACDEDYIKCLDEESLAETSSDECLLTKKCEPRDDEEMINKLTYSVEDNNLCDINEGLVENDTTILDVIINENDSEIGNVSVLKSLDLETMVEDKELLSSGKLISTPSLDRLIVEESTHRTEEDLTGSLGSTPTSGSVTNTPMTRKGETSTSNSPVFIPKIPSDFELEPYAVESDLLKPIKIDSNLLLIDEDGLESISMDKSDKMT
ncbi:uncharacterized protein LOC124438092 isoform X2 [Xenia sp. Carnegie-2017]|uniref:uncharacterized protein LOC124438092 isoform X2 n=1 Tax=Xenia sp. Carnegie-2017 TaxID=2897299 RepID=UPI001F04E4F5|nr:uncharacterized protein LOC124438092 isoform X2 [Xenia sp. Carnegie-2017]